MSELQWLDQPTEEGWWWLGSPGGNAFPVRVVNCFDRLYCLICGATPVKDMPGRWAPMPLVMVPAPPPPEPQPEIVDCQMVRVGTSLGDFATVLCSTRNGVYYLISESVEYMSRDEFVEMFHLPPGFEWPEKMLRL